jgi:hypothetical protein
MTLPIPKRELERLSIISTMSSTSTMSCAKKLELLRDHIDLFNDWEVDFIAGVSHRRRLTPKQYAVLNGLVRQVLKAAA